MRRMLLMLALALVPTLGHAQTDPLLLPLAQPGDFTYLSKWTYGPDDGRNIGTASSLGWNGGIAGLSSNGRLYVRCHEHMARVAEVQPPANWTGVGKITGQCADVNHLWSIDPQGGSTGGSLRIGGAVAYNGRTIIAAHVYYGGTTAVGSHFVGTSHTAMTSPVNTLKSPMPGATPAMFSSNGGMTPVPAIWQALLGGPMLVGGCCQAVISRSSFGPSVHVFDPDALPLAGGGTVPARTLIAFPQAHQTLGAWDGPDAGGYNMNSMVGFSFIVPGTRTLAVVGGKGTGYCYGVGTSDPALVGKPDGTGTNYCFDPTDGNRGGHGYPYVNAVWLWDLAAVLAAKNPWDTKPYYYGGIPALAGFKGRIVGGAFVEASGTVLVTMGAGDNPMDVHALKIGTGAPPPPPPVNCVGIWSESLSEPTPLVCDASDPFQTRTRTKTFTVTTAEQHGGTCVERAQSPIITTERTACTPPPPPPPPPAPALVGVVRAVSPYTLTSSTGIRVTLQVAKTLTPPAKGAAVQVVLPLADGTSQTLPATIYAVKLSGYAVGDHQVTVQVPGISALSLKVLLP